MNNTIPPGARPAKWLLNGDEETVLNGVNDSLNMFKSIFGRKYGSLTKSKRDMALMFTDMRLFFIEYVATQKNMISLTMQENEQLKSEAEKHQSDLKILADSRDRLVVKMGKLEGKIQMLHTELYRKGEIPHSVGTIMKEDS